MSYELLSTSRKLDARTMPASGRYMTGKPEMTEGPWFRFLPGALCRVEAEYSYGFSLKLYYKKKLSEMVDFQ